MGFGTADLANVSCPKPKYARSQAKIARTRRPEPEHISRQPRHMFVDTAAMKLGERADTSPSVDCRLVRIISPILRFPREILIVLKRETLQLG